MKPTEQQIQAAAEHWVWMKNAQKWSNNNNEAGDNFGSFIAGAKWSIERMKDKYDPSEIIDELRDFSCIEDAILYFQAAKEVLK